LILPYRRLFTGEKQESFELVEAPPRERDLLFDKHCSLKVTERLLVLFRSYAITFCYFISYNLRFMMVSFSFSASVSFFFGLPACTRLLLWRLAVDSSWIYIISSACFGSGRKIWVPSWRIND